MEKSHVISDSLFNEAQAEFAIGRNWIAYNTKTYFLDNADMWFFRDKDEAIEFANDNISDVDSYAVIYANSMISLMRQLPYGQDIHFNLTQKELEELFQSIDWKDAFYDPLHDTIEASTEQEKDELARMETLLVEWENLYNRNPEVALQLAATYWEGHPMQTYKEDFLTIKYDLMNERNFDYLKSNIRNHGFGETLGPELETALKAGQGEFTLAFKTEVNKREMEATLYFKKSNESDLYFFNKYDTRLKNEKDETIAQTFYINNGWGVTLKEAYNLLNGRAVHKELTSKDQEKYQAWIQLDFSAKDKNGNFERKQFHQNYGYDLKEALSYYPVKEMQQKEEMEKLIRSLEKGNVQMVTMQISGKDERVFIEANPQYKTINLYNSKFQRLDQEQRQELMNKPELKEGKEQGKGKEKSQELGKEDQPEKKQGKGRKVNGGSAGEDNGLVTKKRSSNKKGLGI